MSFYVCKRCDSHAYSIPLSNRVMIDDRSTVLVQVVKIDPNRKCNGPASQG